MEKKILYIGMDVHKKSIDVAITDERANGKVRSYGKIDGTLEALDKLIRKLKSNASDLHFVYEAGPCGYPIYRHLTSEGHNCSVVAPYRYQQSEFLSHLGL
jgi:transposase